MLTDASPAIRVSGAGLQLGLIGGDLPGGQGELSIVLGTGVFVLY